MTRKERERLKALEHVIQGILTYADAAAKLGLSERQLYRSMERYRSDGDAGLIHRLRGATSNKRKPLRLRNNVVKLYKDRYDDYGPTLFMEALRDDHQIMIGVETLRQWLLKAGYWEKVRKGRRHRKKRPRRAAIGDLVQFDGSQHAWFEDRGPACCLLVAIDDASGTIMIRLAESESTDPVLAFWIDYVQRFGVPQEVYTDYGAVYYHSAQGDDPTKKTDYGFAMTDIGARCIYASSPQAKGRVERMNRTLQDRLLKAFRQHKIKTIEEGNRFIENVFLPKFNRQFAHTISDDGIALADHHRTLTLTKAELARTFARRATRCVRNDLTITLDNRWVQLTSTKSPLPPCGSHIHLRRFLDGSLHIFWQGNELGFEILASNWIHPKKSQGHPASEQHPWRQRPAMGKAKRRRKPKTSRRVEGTPLALRARSVPSTPT
jgi:hypothetical protein